MSPKAFLLLSAATALSVVGATAAVVTRADFATASLGGGEPMLPALAARPDSVTDLVIEYPGYRIALRKDGAGWVASEMGDYPVKGEAATQLVAAMSQFTRVEARTENPEWYPYIRVAAADAPLPAQGIRVIARAGDEVLADLLLGRASNSIGQTRFGGLFVRPTDEPQAWLVEGAAGAPPNLADWFEQLFSIPGIDMVGVEVLEGDTLLLDVEKEDPASGDYHIEAIAPGIAPETYEAADERIRTLTQAAVSVVLLDVRSREGLDVPADARTIRFTRKDGLIVAVTLVPTPERIWALFDASAPAGSPAEADAESLRARTASWAFGLPDRRINLMSTPVAELVQMPEAQAAPNVAPGTPMINGLPGGPIPLPSAPPVNLVPPTP
jgi:hypothetical protein